MSDRNGKDRKGLKVVDGESISKEFVRNGFRKITENDFKTWCLSAGIFDPLRMRDHDEKEVTFKSFWFYDGEGIDDVYSVVSCYIYDDGMLSIIPHIPFVESAFVSAEDSCAYLDRIRDLMIDPYAYMHPKNWAIINIEFLLTHIRFASVYEESLGGENEFLPEAYDELHEEIDKLNELVTTCDMQLLDNGYELPANLFALYKEIVTISQGKLQRLTKLDRGLDCAFVNELFNRYGFIIDEVEVIQSLIDTVNG